MLSRLLEPFSAQLAAHFRNTPIPAAISTTAPHSHGEAAPELSDPGQRIAILVGPAACADADALHRLADHLGAPVANTWGAKGIFAWDSPHHMGTCGLQREDFALLGFSTFDLILAVGIDEAESPRARYALTRVAELVPDQIAGLLADTTPRSLRPAPNELYTRISAIAQPGYVDDSFPRHPARAVMDLKRTLGPRTRLTAEPGLAGLWVARTFPTDRIGSVIVPARAQPGIGAAVGLVSAGHDTETVCVVHGPADSVTEEVMNVAAHHSLPLRLEVWEDDVDWSRTEDLIAAAGPVIAWTG